ncbi:asparagine synthase (glutamine-hydrolyzing) [Parablastomonas sp. CN1-191]|uniref:asparagine synthase (glutamine-hydrolyzing) n=1 Tax=Parablastomonas sp. CN1-191 TaxID=3400908 RepID=UPI003BF8EC32
MCGFAGLFAPGGLSAADRAALPAMGLPIVHRGPDAGDTWSDDPAGIGFVHRRLAIIDLSPAGAQPMASASGRYVIAYNGEIYNYPAIRAELDAAGKAPAWRGHSDTEVLLAAIEAWGIEGALARSAGMFAFALWDREARRLTLARDRLGEKPLYYGWQGEGAARRLLFGSDLAALRAHPAFAAEIEPRAIAELCRKLYVPEPLSVYRGIAKLAPGTTVTIEAASGAETIARWYDLVAVAAAARRDPFAGDEQSAVDALDNVLGAAIERQMVSDVPLGAFLSGGIDSTTVVALMQRASPRPVKTFTIGFEDERFDEALHARKVAAHLGTEHHELRVAPADALAVIPQLAAIYSEPFADSSQIPTFLVSRMARAEVTVALSGDGGDEMFGGYNRHRYAQQTWPALSRIPRPLRSGAGRLIHAVSPAAWERALGRVSRGKVALVGDKLHKAADVLASGSVAELYGRLIAANPLVGELLRRSHSDAPPALGVTADWAPAETMMALDSLGYLPGDILVKVDRAAMAVSLETRVPFLDPGVVAFAWTLPIGMKIRGGETKWPLRALLDRFVPRALMERPKMGFGLPLAEWLRGPLRDWAEDLLDPRALRDGGLFDAAAVQQLWQLHVSGARNVEHRLWPVLMTQAWLAHEAAAAGK